MVTASVPERKLCIIAIVTTVPLSYVLVLLRLRKGHNKGHSNHYGGMPGEGW